MWKSCNMSNNLWHTTNTESDAEIDGDDLLQKESIFSFISNSDTLK